MFDVWFGKIELTSFVLVFSFIVLLPIQLFLCFKVKKRIVRILPLIIFSAMTLFFTVMAIVTTDWGRVGYVFLSIFACFMALICGVGYGATFLIKHIKKRL